MTSTATAAAMRELSSRIDSIKANILYENRLKVPDKKLMHAWFKYFDQNLKGVQGADVKLTLYSAFKTMADKGVLMPPFNLSPHDKTQKGLPQLSDFSRKYDEGYFKKRVEDFIEAKKEKERPKTAPVGKRETKTTVTNKKVVDEGLERKTTLTTTLEVTSQEAGASATMVAEKPQLRRSKTTLDHTAGQKLKRERTVMIKSLEEEIIKAGKALSPDNQDMIESWLKTLNDKLKRETELEDRIMALTALKVSLGARKLLPPFDQVPARGKLNIREFMSRIDLDKMVEEAMLSAPVRKKKPTTAPVRTEEHPKTQRPATVQEEYENPLVEQVVFQAVVAEKPQLRRSKTTLDHTAGQKLKRERTAVIKGLEEEIIKAGKALSPDKQDMVESWLKTLNDKLKRETELEDRILALTALKTSLGARKLLPPFDQVPARGKLNTREFLSRIDLDKLEEEAMLAAPVKKKKKATAPVIVEKDPRTPHPSIVQADLANPLVKNDVIQAVVQNMGRAMNAICAEDIETLQEIPPMTEQVTTAVITSPHRIIHRYEFTPLELHEPDVPTNRVRQRLYETLPEIDVDDDIEAEAQPDLDQSILGSDDDEPFLVPPHMTSHSRELEFTSFEEERPESQFDPVTFAMDHPEFHFIPNEIKAYIKRLVKKELVHWPTFLQDLGREFNWPQFTETGELIEFSPMK